MAAVEPSPARVRAPRGATGRGALAVLLLALGLMFAVFYRIADGSEHHSYNSGALAPTTVHVTAGRQYEISVSGGVKAVQAHVDPASITCTYRLGGGAQASLAVSPLGSDTRTLHAVATFVSPKTGDVHIDCAGLAGGVYVDDADNTPADLAGLFVLLTTIALTLGAALGLSELYRRSTARRGEHDQVEGRVRVGEIPSEHGEVVDPDGGDVPGQFG